MHWVISRNIFEYLRSKLRGVWAKLRDTANIPWLDSPRLKEIPVPKSQEGRILKSRADSPPLLLECSIMLKPKITFFVRGLVAKDSKIWGWASPSPGRLFLFPATNSSPLFATKWSGMRKHPVGSRKNDLIYFEIIYCDWRGSHLWDVGNPGNNGTRRRWLDKVAKNWVFLKCFRFPAVVPGRKHIVGLTAVKSPAPSVRTFIPNCPFVFISIFKSALTEQTHSELTKQLHGDMNRKP